MECYNEQIVTLEEGLETPKNQGVLANISEDERGNLLYKGKTVSGERPTATIEAMGALLNCTTKDIPYDTCIVIGDASNKYFSEIPYGAEIKTVEFKLESQEEWIDIHRMFEIDGVPCSVCMNRAYDGTATISGNYKDFAIISPAIYEATNFLYDAINSYEKGDIRITYYTDNIGGENNA